MLTIKVVSKGINELRKILMEKEIMDMNYKILTEDSYGYIPIKLEKINKPELKNTEKEKINIKHSLRPKENITADHIIKIEKKDMVLLNQVKEELNKKLNNTSGKKIAIELIEKDLEEIKRYPRSINEYLKGTLDENEIENLKKSFDIIGDVVILEIPENLEKQKDIIGEAALRFTKRQSIFMKKSAVEGIRRTRKIEHIAGKNESETIHKEHGVRLKLDVKDVYFSPRLATERNRVSEQVKDSEVILDMFAGIGPFPILIAKNRDVEIYAVDINPIAIKYMKENIQLNKLKGKITPINEDINQIVIEKFKKESIKFDRIIMNLPGSSSEFLDLAITLIKNNGVIHYYEFSDDYENGINKIKKIANKYDKTIEILNTRKVKSSSPGMWHVVIDAKIIKNNS